jgi:hypothetical protein
MAKDVADEDDTADLDRRFSFGGPKVSGFSLYHQFLRNTEADPLTEREQSRVAQSPTARDGMARLMLHGIAQDVMDAASDGLTRHHIEASDVAARKVLRDFLFGGSYRRDNAVVADACAFLAASALLTDLSITEPQTEPDQPTWGTVKAAADLMEWVAITGIRGKVKTNLANEARSDTKRRRVARLVKAIRSGDLPERVSAKRINRFYKDASIVPKRKPLSEEAARLDLLEARRVLKRG